MAEKQSNKDRIKEITAGIEQGIKELFESDRYRKYLTTMSRFHKYSLNNVMLIHSQRPDATLVAGFNKWKNSFGRHVKKGEKGIQILAPTPYKIKVEKEKLDPDIFFRCHRSYSVNLRHTTRINNREYTMRNGDLVPISRAQYKVACEKFAGL